MKKVICIILIALILTNNVYGEENVKNMPGYQLDDFLNFFDIRLDKKNDLLCQSIVLDNLFYLQLSGQKLFENFPIYESIRGSKSDERRNYSCYVTYHLTNGNRLVVFIKDGYVAYVCYLLSACSPSNFSLITEGTPANEVIKIDANTVFNPFIQWGPISEHYTSDGTIWRIVYKQAETFMGEFVVESVDEIAQHECLTILRYIDVDDLIMRG